MQKYNIYYIPYNLYLICYMLFLKIEQFYFSCFYIKIMTSAYLAISFLKQTPLPEKQLKIFLTYLPQEPLK